MKAGRDAQAEQMLVAMTRAYGQLAGPYVNLGIIYRRTGRGREAEQAFRRAIALSPGRADAYNHLGIVLRENGRFREAREAYESALRIDPSYAYAQLNLGILYDLYLFEAKKALQHYERYQKLVAAPDPKVAKWMVDLRRRMKRQRKTASR
jgi:Flp pilus assembly protein TadD